MGDSKIKDVTKHGNKGYKGVYAAKMQKQAELVGCDYINGKFVKKKAPPAEPAAKAKSNSASEPMKMRVIKEDETYKSEFFKALHNTVIEPGEKLPEEPATPPAPEPKAGEPKKEEPKTAEEPKKGESAEKEEPKAAEEPPPGFGFDFEWDDEDVDKALDMIPLITIPISSLIAWFFNRTLNPELITMPEWKKNLLRPGVKHYGKKIMEAISTPEFFWTALVGLIIFDALFNSVKNPTDPGEEKNKEEQEEEWHEAAEAA
jgi:hypothetical protein